jgi:hypothetical protein
MQVAARAVRAAGVAGTLRTVNLQQWSRFTTSISRILDTTCSLGVNDAVSEAQIWGGSISDGFNSTGRLLVPIRAKACYPTELLSASLCQQQHFSTHAQSELEPFAYMRAFTLLL